MFSKNHAAHKSQTSSLIVPICLLITQDYDSLFSCGTHNYDFSKKCFTLVLQDRMCQSCQSIGIYVSSKKQERARIRVNKAVKEKEYAHSWLFFIFSCRFSCDGKLSSCAVLNASLLMPTWFPDYRAIWVIKKCLLSRKKIITAVLAFTY